MRYGSLVIEKKEYVALKQLLNLAESYKEPTRKQSVLRLEKELETAIISNEEEMPEDVIRFNSEVVVATADGWENSFELVSPTESNFSNKKISILTPMGLAVIGYAKGDVIDWEFPGGSKSLEIKDVKQIQKVK
ncbi:GreA/GreB family elongation factor [Lacinutrix iliipiscaria]|uniref:GreA/GreB family elongation factor n=1 Tax=Lacinutrix iliipiscaria TaxID=1230532 RepID=A0ABW5WS32_9FLAO